MVVIPPTNGWKCIKIVTFRSSIVSTGWKYNSFLITSPEIKYVRCAFCYYTSTQFRLEYSWQLFLTNKINYPFSLVASVTYGCKTNTTRAKNTNPNEDISLIFKEFVIYWNLTFKSCICMNTILNLTYSPKKLLIIQLNNWCLKSCVIFSDD